MTDPTTPDDTTPTRGPLGRIAYNPVEAAALLGLSRATVFRLIAEGAIPSVKIGRARRIRATDIDAWLDSLGDA